MAFKSDIEIAQEATMLPITKVAENLGIEEEDLECYGRYKAKLSNSLWKKIENRPDGKLILVTAINPTPAISTPYRAEKRRLRRSASQARENNSQPAAKTKTFRIEEV